jgi:CBS domain-containing protein
VSAALRMQEHTIGSLVVVEQGGLAGIITERDLVRAAGDGTDPLQTTRGRVVEAPGAPLTPRRHKRRMVRAAHASGDGVREANGFQRLADRRQPRLVAHGQSPGRPCRRSAGHQ